MALSNRQSYHQAIGQFLNALALNPNAEHIWDYIKTTSGYMENEQFVQMAMN